MQKHFSRRSRLPLLALTNSIGLACVSFAFYLSVLRYSSLALESFFFLGLLLMFVPGLLRLLSPACSRLERLCLLCMLGFYFYLVQFMVSPLHFSSFDDFLHWRTVADILRTGHLFSVNSMLPVSPYYPGLEIVTDAVSTMTGLSPFYAGVLVICASRILMVLSLFLLYEQVTRSSHLAGIGTLIYMVNPHFIFFDATFSYETLALPLATFTLYLLARFEHRDKDYRWIIFTAWLVLAAVTITHHMTDYVLIALLMLWVMVSLLRPSSRAMRMHLISLTLFGALLALVYAVLLPGNPVWGYLSGYYEGAFKELGHILAGSSEAHRIFSSTGQPIPIWDSLLRTAFVTFVTFSIPFGLLALWRRYHHNALAVMLGIFSLAYPITQVFRFTTFGSEITDRAAAFLFLSVACILAVVIAFFWPWRRLKRRSILFITSTLAVVFVGGVLIAIGSNYAALPGPYAVVADGLSVEPEGIDAATWSLTYLGPDNRIATDRINQMLMSTYGDQRVVTRLDDNVDVSPIFYSPQLDPNDIGLIDYGKMRYLVVDLRLSTSLPLIGFYFENDQPTAPISREALTKFNTISPLDRLFDSGNIIIYDTGELFNGHG
jgi:hypothetical protein